MSEDDGAGRQVESDGENNIFLGGGEYTKIGKSTREKDSGDN